MSTGRNNGFNAKNTHTPSHGQNGEISGRIKQNECCFQDKYLVPGNWYQVCNIWRNVVGGQMLDASQSEVGTVLRFERNA